MANYIRNPWTPTDGGNTLFPCPGCTAEITIHEMTECGGLIEGEDGS